MKVGANPVARRLPDRRQADPQETGEARGDRFRQSLRVGKRTLIQHQRYAHAKRRANRQLRKLKTLVAPSCDIGRKINGDASAFLRPLWLGERVILPRNARAGAGMHWKGQGPQALRSSGLKVSVATTLNRCKGGQFAIHAKALPGSLRWPYAADPRDRSSPAPP